MRRCSQRTSTYWSAAAPGGLCRPASGYRLVRSGSGSSANLRTVRLTHPWSRPRAPVRCRRGCGRGQASRRGDAPTHRPRPAQDRLVCHGAGRGPLSNPGSAASAGDQRLVRRRRQQADRGAHGCRNGAADQGPQPGASAAPHPCRAVPRITRRPQVSRCPRRRRPAG